MKKTAFLLSAIAAACMSSSVQANDTSDGTQAEVDFGTLLYEKLMAARRIDVINEDSVPVVAIPIGASPLPDVDLIQLNTNFFQTPDANQGPQYIKDSYIVMFNEPLDGEERLVPEFRRYQPGMVQRPMGEKPSVEDTSKIATALNLNGEITNIFTSINAVHINMSAEEAERLSANPYVKLIEQNTISYSASTSFTTDRGLEGIDVTGFYGEDTSEEEKAANAFKDSLVELLNSRKREPSIDATTPSSFTLELAPQLTLQLAPQLTPQLMPATPIENSYIVTFNERVEGDVSLIKEPQKYQSGMEKMPFGKKPTFQEMFGIYAKLNLTGKVTDIYESINAIHVEMTEQEANRLATNQYVKSIEKNAYTQLMYTQFDPNNALDSLDETSFIEDSTYNYAYTGAGQTIWVLDSGLDFTNQAVLNEFGDRAEFVYDFNVLNPEGDGPSVGTDCQGHGTKVASAAGGNTYGVAKGVTLKIVKITDDCSTNALITNAAHAFNWIAQNERPGTIINYSHGLENENQACLPTKYSATLENSIKAAHDAGMIVVVAAGNDACNVANFSPSNIPEAFVVGSTGEPINDKPTYSNRHHSSRIGPNLAGFAPGAFVRLLGKDGSSTIDSGTSFSAPFTAGVFAVACEAADSMCQDNISSAAPVYEALKEVSPTGTVFDSNGIPMIGSPSRFISQQW